MRQYCKKLVSIVFIYLVLSLSMAMSVFSAAEAPTIDVKFEDKIYHSTGDMTLTLPLLNVPGRGDSSFPINLYYTGGGGIPIESEASWVGLGWSLDIGSINRFVKGLPDDTLKITDSNYPDNVYMIWKQVVKDETPWYKKLVNVVPWIILFIIACVTSPDKATPFVFKIAHWLMFKAIAYEMSGSRGTFFSLTDAIDLVGFTKGTKVDLMKSKTIVELINIYGYAGTAYSAFSMVGYVVGASPTTVNTKPAPHKQNGYLYDPFYEEIVRDDKPLLSDGGSPDIYAISGPGVGGSMILGSSATTGRHTTSADAEFFMANIPSRNAVDIDFYNQIDHCEDYDPAVSSSRPIQGLTYENAEERLQLNKELGLCKTMSGDIDMFVVTLTDGSRLVY